MRSIISAKNLVATIALIGLTGCAATQNVSDPHAITLKDALVDTVDALKAAHDRSVKDHTHFGFYGCSVTAVFNVSATGTQDNKLSLTASGPPATILPVTFVGAASSEATASGTRGNTVTVVLGTKYCLPNASASEIKKPAPVGAPAVKKSPIPGKNNPPPVKAAPPKSGASNGGGNMGGPVIEDVNPNK